MKSRKYRGTTNPNLKGLIFILKKTKKPVWKRVAEILEKPSRKRPAVNVKKIDRYVNDGEVVVIPGKVLGYGDIMKKVTVGAFSYSERARKKLEQAGCKTMTIKEMVEKNIIPSKILV